MEQMDGFTCTEYDYDRLNDVGQLSCILEKDTASLDNSI